MYVCVYVFSCPSANGFVGEWKLELIWQQERLAAEVVSHGARRAAPASADRLMRASWYCCCWHSVGGAGCCTWAYRGHVARRSHLFDGVLLVVAAHPGLFLTQPLGPNSDGGAAWTEFHPDDMWLSLCAWDFPAKLSRPLCDILVPGLKQVRPFAGPPCRAPICMQPLVVEHA